MKIQNVYIGNCTNNGIYFYKLKKDNLTKVQFTNDHEKCTYIAANEQYLYSTIEIQETNGYILSYKICDDKLIQLNKKSSKGKGPCHINIDEKNKLIYVCNYVDGNFTIFEKRDDGTIGKEIYHEENNSHVHCSQIEGKNFFVTDLGKDTVTAYEIKENNIIKVSQIKFEKGTEPRHIAVNKDKIYVITEKSCEIYVLKFQNEKLEIIDKVSILPKGIEKKENFTGCAIKIDKNKKFIYTTIRGHNSISIYKIKNDKINMIQNISCKGELPRDLEIDNTNKYILVANSDSNDISIFKRNRITGKLRYINRVEMKAPTCIVIR